MTGRKEFSCGLGRWRPEWLQKFATMRYFMVVYGLLGTIQAMSFVYFVATLTTLEKRFQIRSEVTGILMTGNEMSQIFLSIFLAYRGGKGNRPLWIAWGVLCSSLSCFILALPHFIYGPGPNALALTEEFFDHRVLNLSSSAPSGGRRLTQSGGMSLRGETICWNSGSKSVGSEETTRSKSTRVPPDGNQCKQQNLEKPLLSLCLIFFSQFVLGIGTTLYVTLGQPYLDDNSKKKNTPKLLGLMMALRTAGPALGFILGFLCLNIYIEPSAVPVIERTDPRWLGAWWLGWVILGTVMTVFSFLIAAFPRQLRPTELKPDPNGQASCMYESVSTKTAKGLEVQSTKTASVEMFLVQEDEVGVFTDFKNAMKRVCGNALLMSNTFVAVFYILGASGFINFYTKYSETQFHQSAALSSMIAGVTTVVSMVVGFSCSGYLISRFRPRERSLLLFNVVIAAVYMAAEVVFMFLGCSEDTLQGSVTESGLFDPNLECNANCSCELINYSPVCFEKGRQTFFSACHAGCAEIQESSQVIYSNCSCLPDPTDTVRLGPCKVNCTLSFVAFIAVQCLIHLVGCSGRITNILISYRCVEPRDKPLAQGITLFTISLLAFIPGPIIYGKVIDSTCQIWDEKCGKRGNCWVYDKMAFRTYLNTTGLCFTFGAFIFDVIVYILGKDIKLYEETTDKAKT